MGDPRQKSAEILALQALDWLVSDGDRAAAWLAETGIAPPDLRGRLAEPEVLAGILDHLLSADALLLDFAAAAGISPQAVLAARRALPGGAAFEAG